MNLTDRAPLAQAETGGTLPKIAAPSPIWIAKARICERAPRVLDAEDLQFVRALRSRLTMGGTPSARERANLECLFAGVASVLAERQGSANHG